MFSWKKQPVDTSVHDQKHKKYAFDNKVNIDIWPTLSVKTGDEIKFLDIFLTFNISTSVVIAPLNYIV
jgi:hypothetical protein